MIRFLSLDGHHIIPTLNRKLLFYRVLKHNSMSLLPQVGLQINTYHQMGCPLPRGHLTDSHSALLGGQSAVASRSLLVTENNPPVPEKVYSYVSLIPVCFSKAFPSISHHHVFAWISELMGKLVQREPLLIWQSRVSNWLFSDKPLENSFLPWLPVLSFFFLS